MDATGRQSLSDPISWAQFHGMRRLIQHMLSSQEWGVSMAVRHLIAHRGGLVDAKFKSDVKDFPEYFAIEIGNMVPLTGPIVGKHLNACVVFGVSLFNAVNEWSVTADTE